MKRSVPLLALSLLFSLGSSVVNAAEIYSVGPISLTPTYNAAGCAGVTSNGYAGTDRRLFIPSADGYYSIKDYTPGASSVWLINLYDFRGVNHNIVFAIHYYSAKQKQKFEKSIINPEYKMNFIDYKYLQEENEDDSDIENDINDSVISIEDYKEMEKKYSDKKYDSGYELNYENIRKQLYDNINDD